MAAVVSTTLRPASSGHGTNVTPSSVTRRYSEGVGRSGDDDLVEAGQLHFRAEMAAAAESPRIPVRGRAGGDRIVGRGGQQRSRERADAEDEDVVRAHRIGGRIELLRQTFGVGGAPAHHVLHPSRVERLDFEPARGQVHAEDPAAVAPGASATGHPPGCAGRQAERLATNSARLWLGVSRSLPGLNGASVIEPPAPGAKSIAPCVHASTHRGSPPHRSQT